MKIIFGIFIGMLGVGLAQGIVEYYFGSSGGASFINTGSQLIGAITVGIFGAMGGAGIGLLASVFSFPLPQSLAINFVLSLLASIVFFLLIGDFGSPVKQAILVFLIFGTLFGTIASLINQNYSGH